MPKQKPYYGDFKNTYGETKNTFAEVQEENYNKYRKIQNLLSAEVRAVGVVSGQSYQWQKAGVIVDVLAEDVEGLLAKRVGGKSCCSGNAENKVFQLVED